MSARWLAVLDPRSLARFNSAMSGDLESNAELAPAYLVQHKGASTGRRFALEEGEHIIGRGTGISVQIDSSEVSRHHARILVDAGGAELFDLGSKNGIWVGSNRVEGTARIGHGDHFTLGDVEEGDGIAFIPVREQCIQPCLQVRVRRRQTFQA